MTTKIIKVGSRESALAMWQTTYVIEQLQAVSSDYTFEIIPIKTKGDKILDVSLSKVGDKGLFTKELEVAILSGEVDFAVHSMKDMPTAMVEGLQISAILPRHDPSDVVISKDKIPFAELPLGAKVGTSSLRRRAQILQARPDLNIQDIRGNLQTRMRKMVDEKFDALILAAAGVERMGWADQITEKLSFDVCLPAVGQGAIGVETRSGDVEMIRLVQLVNDADTTTCVTAERALLGALEGGCQIPIGAYAELDGDTLALRGLVGSLDGRQIIKDQISGLAKNAGQLGEALAEKLKGQGAMTILEAIRQEMN